VNTGLLKLLPIVYRQAASFPNSPCHHPVENHVNGGRSEFSKWGEVHEEKLGWFWDTCMTVSQHLPQDA